MTTDTLADLKAALATWREKRRAYLDAVLHGEGSVAFTLAHLGDADDVLAAAYDAHVADQQPQADHDSEVDRLRRRFDIAKAEYESAEGMLRRDCDEARAEVDRLRAKLAEARRGREANFEALSALRWELAEAFGLLADGVEVPPDGDLIARLRAAFAGTTIPPAENPAP